MKELFDDISDCSFIPGQENKEKRNQNTIGSLDRG